MTIGQGSRVSPREAASTPAQGSRGEAAPAPGSAAPAVVPPGPEMMLGLWAAWAEAASKLGRGMASAPDGMPKPAAWQMPSDQLAGSLLQGGLRQLGEMLAKDPILRATEDALNANPLHQVIPVDWAEIARALRTVWLQTVSRPAKALAAVAERFAW